MSTPISGLAPEILSEIFSHALSSGIRMAVSLPNFNPPIGNPWTLALVCRLWKSIIFSTPTLWTSLSIDFLTASNICTRRGIKEDDVDRLTNALLDTVRVALLRSLDLPLHISIVSDADISALRFVPETLLLCVQHSKRWKGAYLEFWCDLLDSSFPNLLEVLGRDEEGNKRVFPLLQQIFLKGPGRLFPPIRITSTSWLRLFQEAPISKVWFKADPHLFPELGEIFTWSHITEFSTEMSDIKLFYSCCDILRGMPKLKVFKLTIFSYTLRPTVLDREGPLRTGELPELRDFWISPDQGSPLDLSIVFKFFPRAPNLSRLSIQPKRSIEITSGFLPELRDFVDRSKCTITHLEISNLPVYQTTILFRLLPDVESLVAEGIHFDEGLITHMSVPPDGSHLQPGTLRPLLPKVKRMNVAGIVRPGFEPYFINIFESRRSYPAMEGGPTLESAYVEFSLLQSA